MLFKVSLKKIVNYLQQIDNKRKQIQYEIGDNDFYWFHFSDKTYFLVIPEKELIDKEYIGNKINKKVLNVNILSIQTDHYHWLYPYFFDYNNIDKIRLRSLFTIEYITKNV